MKADLKITTALAATLLAAGCQRQDNGWTADRDTAICVDRSGKRVPDAQCPRTAEAGHGGGVSPFLWYYLGRSSVVPYYGDPVRGGSFTGRAGTSYGRAPAEVAMTRSAAISRGGFGSSAQGGEGGEGGGHGAAGE
ncbi:hypothetical protein [uncultured Sphingomonas sp.]|uniref:hypothetical protein n=1 Tax=uncultured Sphingomonas sp. TaxID=158754 RepID=UPI0035CBBD81